MVSDSRQEIMEATYKALSKHGHKDLTIEKIGKESEKGKSLIYYHFDNKEDLMLSFLDHLNTQIEKDLQKIEELEPENKLDKLLDMLLGVEDKEMLEFQKALSELKVQAQHNQKYAKKFRKLYKMLTDLTSEILTETDVENPKINAEIIISAVEGAISSKTILEDERNLSEIKKGIKQALVK